MYRDDACTCTVVVWKTVVGFIAAINGSAIGRDVPFLMV